MELNIFNQQEEKVAILSTAQNGSHVPIYDANIEEKLDSYDILTFTIDADTEESTYAVEGNTIIFKDIKGWREYYITNVEEEDGDILQKTITAELSLIELADEIIEKDLSGTTTNPKVALASLLEGTRFEVGIVDESIYNKRFNTDTFYLNVLEAISELASEYSAEVQVSYQIKDGKIEKRLINLYKQFGRNNGKRFEIEKDITSIKRTVDISQLKTAIIPFTDEKTSQDKEGNESSGSRITINDVVWSKAKGDPTDKPLGQNYLEDKTALANFGRIGKDGKLKHKKISMEINVDSAEALISMAWVQLARYSTPKVTYEVKAVDLYELTKDEDFKHEQIFLGDTIIAVDKNFAVPIVIETRVVEVKRDLLDATNNEYVFGTSKELFSYQEQLDSIEEKIKDVVINIDNIQQNADGFTTTYRGSTQPATARENDLWYRPHPTIVGERQMLIFNGTTWEIASDTSVKGLVDKDILEVQNDTQLAIQKAQDAVDLAESIEGSLIFKVGTEEYNAKMTTLEDNINLRVTKNDVIHQINISDEQILIAGDKIIISGDTTVDGSFKVTNQMIADGISADKITAGTINGQTVNIINVNADNITGGNLDIQNMNIKNGNQTILSVNQAGEVVMNVSSLRIGQFNAVTTEDLEKLESQYTFILSNDSATIPTDKDGNNGDYTTATTQPIIYRLGVLDTNSWNITASASAGVTGTFLNGEYKVTNMTADTGKITFTAKKDNLTLLKVFNISKAKAGSNGATGATGAQGASATSYWITASNNIIGKSQTGVINPTTITFKGFSKTGTANSVAYSGRFIIQTSTNGTTYTTKYTSSADQNGYTYTIPTDSLFVKCLFYMAGGTTVLLDEQTVPIVESAEGIQVGGEQLMKALNDTNYTGIASKTSEYVRINGKDSAENNFYPKFFIPAVPGEYVYSYKIDIPNIRVLVKLFDDNKVDITDKPVPGYTWNIYYKGYFKDFFGGYQPAKFTIPAGVSFMTVTLVVVGSTTKNPISVNLYWHKLEKGNIPTDWRPHPQDARTHKAWANSSDGTVDFTRVYINENLLLDTKFDGESWTSYGSPTISYPVVDGTKNIKMVKTDTSQQGIRTANTLDLEKGVQYTLSYQARGNLPTSNNYVMLSPNPNYSFHSGTGDLTATFKQFTQTFTVPTSLTGVSVDILFTHTYGTGAIGQWLEIKGGTVKLERGTTPTVYTTNTAGSLTGSVPKYVGFSPLDSSKPSDYEWIINPEWTQASAKEALTNKADKGEIDDINNALGDKVNNGAFNELKTTLELFQDSYKGFVQDGGQHEQDLIDLEGRMTQLLLSLDSKVLELDFLKTYMKFGEEGFMIGKDDSQIKMLLKNDRLSFMDAGQEVAFFSGQSFYINRGAIVQSLQVGEHKITNLGNGHTIFQWVGAVG